jgi:hypothetical protein
MSQRSNSTIDRDHRRAIEHQVHLELRELNSIDWKSVENYEIQEYLEELEDLESNCENEHLCEQINELKELLKDLLDRF